MKQKETRYTVKSTDGAVAAARAALERNRQYQSKDVDASGGLRGKQRTWGGCEAWPQEA